jgi:hypothetical protein
MDNYLTILNKKWYYRLKPKDMGNGKWSIGLFTDNPRGAIKNELIICMSYQNGSNKPLRLYSLFKSYIEFSKYQLQYPPSTRHFYEIILGDKCQKPHFDIDIADPSVDGEKVKDNLVKAILDILSDKGVEVNIEDDILIYTSHSSEKQSYHVIVNNWCHVNNDEARTFYEMAKERINDDSLSKWIDTAVYGPTQQFRIVGSQKIGDTRIKKQSLVWKYFDKKIEHSYVETPEDMVHEINLQLEEGLISFTPGCQILPLFITPEIIKAKTTYVESEDIPKELAIESIHLLASMAGIKVTDDKFPYKFDGINGSVVMLKRIKKSMCRICCRVHENENPYLFIIGEERDVYFHCRRAPPNEKLFVGKLGKDKINVDEIFDDSLKLPVMTKMSDSPELPNSIPKIPIMKRNWQEDMYRHLSKVATSSDHIKPTKKPFDQRKSSPLESDILKSVMYN